MAHSPQFLKLVNEAKKQVKDFSFDEEMTEIYRISNQPAKASAPFPSLRGLRLIR